MTALPWIDWDAAEQVGLELVDPGPRVGRPERAQIVTQLREQARRAADLLVEASGLPEVGEARELVVDRRNIIRANVATARRLTSESIGVADSPLGDRRVRAAGQQARSAHAGDPLARPRRLDQLRRQGQGPLPGFVLGSPDGRPIPRRRSEDLSEHGL